MSALVLYLVVHATIIHLVEGETKCDELIWYGDVWKRKKKLREEGIEPPTAGSGIQRSTTELFPHNVDAD